MPVVQILLLATFAASLLGCATPYLITMKDGRTIEAKAEPEPEDGTGFWIYEDYDGKRIRLNKDEIVEIRPK